MWSSISDDKKGRYTSSSPRSSGPTTLARETLDGQSQPAFANGQISLRERASLQDHHPSIIAYALCKPRFSHGQPGFGFLSHKIHRFVRSFSSRSQCCGLSVLYIVYCPSLKESSRPALLLYNISSFVSISQRTIHYIAFFLEPSSLRSQLMS